MPRILLIGNCPLPDESTAKSPASGLRTFQIVEALKADGHAVTAVCIAQPDCYPRERLKVPECEEKNGIACWRLEKDRTDPAAFIAELLKSNTFDCIVAVNNPPAVLAARLRTDLPLWCDLNGSLVAEAQTAAEAGQSASMLPLMREMEATILARADALSVVSSRQKDFVIEELATLGRNVGIDWSALIHVIPNANDVPAPAPDGEEFVRGVLVPASAFIVFWAGAYNNWADVETLFAGLEGAMRESEHVHFVSTGGDIPGFSTHTFRRLRDLVDSSRFASRFHFLGWVAPADLAKCYAECDVGISVDRACIDTRLGARNRINEMIVRNLPVITSIGTEISEELVTASAAFGVPIGDGGALAQTILKLAHEPSLLPGVADRALAFARAHYSNAETTKSLRAWVSAPARLPAFERNISKHRLAFLLAGLSYLRRNGLRRTLKKVWGRRLL